MFNFLPEQSSMRNEIEDNFIDASLALYIE